MSARAGRAGRKPKHASRFDFCKGPFRQARTIHQPIHAGSGHKVSYGALRSPARAQSIPFISLLAEFYSTMGLTPFSSDAPAASLVAI